MMLLVGLMVFLIFVHVACPGNIVLGTWNKQSVECSSNSEITFKFSSLKSNKSLTIAECDPMMQTCRILEKSLENKYNLSYTGRGGILRIHILDEDTYGTYTCCETYNPSNYVSIDICSHYMDAAGNSSDEINNRTKSTSQRSDETRTCIKAVSASGAIVLIIGFTGLIVVFRKKRLSRRKEKLQFPIKATEKDEDLEREMVYEDDETMLAGEMDMDLRNDKQQQEHNHLTVGKEYEIKQHCATEKVNLDDENMLAGEMEKDLRKKVQLQELNHLTVTQSTKDCPPFSLPEPKGKAIIYEREAETNSTKELSGKGIKVTVYQLRELAEGLEKIKRKMEATEIALNHLNELAMVSLDKTQRGTIFSRETLNTCVVITGTVEMAHTHIGRFVDDARYLYKAVEIFTCDVLAKFEFGSWRQDIPTT